MSSSESSHPIACSEHFNWTTSVDFTENKTFDWFDLSNCWSDTFNLTVDRNKIKQYRLQNITVRGSKEIQPTIGIVVPGILMEMTEVAFLSFDPPPMVLNISRATLLQPLYSPRKDAEPFANISCNECAFSGLNVSVNFSETDVLELHLRNSQGVQLLKSEGFVRVEANGLPVDVTLYNTSKLRLEVINTTGIVKATNSRFTDNNMDQQPLNIEADGLIQLESVTIDCSKLTLPIVTLYSRVHQLNNVSLVQSSYLEQKIRFLQLNVPLNGWSSIRLRDMALSGITVNSTLFELNCGMTQTDIDIKKIEIQRSIYFTETKDSEFYLFGSIPSCQPANTTGGRVNISLMELNYSCELAKDQLVNVIPGTYDGVCFMEETRTIAEWITLLPSAFALVALGLYLIGWIAYNRKSFKDNRED